MPNTSQWFIRTDAYPDSQLRLIVFAPAGAGTAFFKGWQAQLAPRIELCPVLLPARERRLKEAPAQQIEVILDALLNDFHALLDKPFAFFGHSFGAILAFELSRLLTAELLPLPKALFLSACRAAHLPIRRGDLHKLPDAEFLAAIAEMGGVPSEILQSRDFLNYLLPALRADMTIFETYSFQAGAALDIPIFALGGLADDWVTTAELAAWESHSTQSFAQRNFEGGHFYLQAAQTELLAYLKSSLPAKPSTG